MTLTTAALLLFAFAAGFAIAWAVASARARAEVAATRAELAGLEKQVADRLAAEQHIRTRLEESQTERARNEASLEAERRNLAEQKKLLDEAQAVLTREFQSLAAAALQNTSQQFLDLASTKFESLHKASAGDLAQRQQAIQSLVAPLDQSLKTLQLEVTRIEASRQQAYGELSTQVQNLARSTKDLTEETGSLKTSLRQPQIKGKWGELTLQRAAELAGMTAHVDFVQQSSLQTEEGRIQPDMVVHLPGDRVVIVDAKVPDEAYRKLENVRNQDEYHQILSEHSRLVRNHVARLASKAYWKEFENTLDFVVLFLPHEGFFSAALQKDPELISEAMDKRVLLASPTTFMAILRAIEYGWRQQQMAENALRICDLGKELYDRVRIFAEHLDKIGKGLESANKAYNNAVGSFQQKLAPGARKFKEMGVQPAVELPELEPTETPVRALAARNEP